MQLDLSATPPMNHELSATPDANISTASLPRSTSLTQSLNRLSPPSTFRALLGTIALGILGLSSGTALAAGPAKTWRAQWGDPNVVTVTGKGQTYSMTYAQFFKWFEPNKQDIKVVGVLPAHIAAQNKNNTPAKPQRQTTQASGNARMTPAQYAAWYKHYQDVAAYQKRMAGYLTSVAPTTVAQPRTYYPQYTQQGGPAQGSFLESLKGVGIGIKQAVKKLGGPSTRQPSYNYTQAQLSAATVQAPRYITPPAAKPPAQKAAAPVPKTKPKATSAPTNKPQPKAPAAPKKSAAPAPQAAPEPDMPTFDVSQLKGTPDLLTLPGRGDLSAEGTPE